MSDLICELVKETDPFLREKPEVFNFESPQVDPEKLSAQLIENMTHHEGLGLSANQIGIPVTKGKRITLTYWALGPSWR